MLKVDIYCIHVYVYIYIYIHDDTVKFGAEGLFRYPSNLRDHTAVHWAEIHRKRRVVLCMPWPFDFFEHHLQQHAVW